MITERITDVFADAGVTGWLHATPVGGGRPAEVDVGADRPVAIASVYKLPLLVAMVRMIDRNELDPSERVTLRPAGRTTGPTGISSLADEVTMSWRDLAALMMTLSDNEAADAILRRVGVAAVRATLTELGLRRTTFVGGTADAYELLHTDTGTTDLAAALDALADADRSIAPRAYDPVLSSSATAREATHLLTRIWTDAAASPAGCRGIRNLMARQVFTARLASGFAVNGVQVAGKTGTLGALRHEIGVVQYEGDQPYAVAVFTQSARAAAVQPAVDTAIGRAARLAVDHLRGVTAASRR